MVIITTRTVDSLAVYNCSSGFELVGMEKRLCLEDGTWNGTEPICKGTIVRILEQRLTVSTMTVALLQILQPVVPARFA